MAAASAGGTTRETASTRVVHASSVRWLERGLLIRGRSGAGKSELVLRLLEAGARLVADDLVVLEAGPRGLRARPPRPAGLLEMRGAGIFRVAAGGSTLLHLVVELRRTAGARLPEFARTTICGVELPQVTVDPLLASTVARLRLILHATRIA